MASSNNYHKALPYECDSGWVAIQNEALTLYPLHPKFNGNTFLVYAYLLKNYNRREGRSYPSIDNMSRTLNMHKDTISRCIDTLDSLDMIDIHRLGGVRRFNNFYTFKQLILDVKAFLERFPEARPQFEKCYGKEILQNEEIIDWL
ncbi:helix-turn-helix domain-containing protein [Lysinibacillus capsici]|uniref:helix-turn-helix domain-containing protein n=1 Tax=Lysinibacillus capsici TaxID=2115968 RepID=UPI000E2069B0|nr:helix-turn-helix domain-containing protein [Lysinibacillus capsici]RDV27129.1 hypothetical protein C7B89_20050 [Lysinibacillus capsici]